MITVEVKYNKVVVYVDELEKSAESPITGTE